MRLTLCILVLTLAIQGNAQEAAILLLDKAASYHMRDMDSCIYYAERLLQLDPPPDDTIVLRSLFLKGWNQHLKSEYNSAISTFKSYLAHSGAREDKLEYIRVLGRIGVGYREMGQVDSALVYLQMYDGLVDTHLGKTAIEAKLELGELYRLMGRHEESNKYKLEAIDRSRESGNKTDRMMSLYYYLDDNILQIGQSEFQPYLEEYLDLIGKARPDGTIDYSHSGLLLIQFTDQEKFAALEHDVGNLEEVNRDKGYLFLNRYLVSEYIDRARFDKAERNALLGLQSAKYRGDAAYLLEYQLALSEIYRATGKYSEALDYVDAYYSYKDSLFTESVMANVDSLNVLFETSEKERVIAGQQLEIQRQRNQRNLLLGSIAALIWFGLFAILFLHNRNRIQHRLAVQESRIQEQKINQLEQEKQLHAMNSMLEGQEAERMRVARDLHDGLGGLLGTIKARFSTIQKEISALENLNVYDQVDQLINTASAEVRRISHNMAPSALRLGGLKDALSDLASQFDSDDLKVTFEWLGNDVRMPEKIEMMLYRIGQELINNVVKHASASSLLVQVNRYDDRMTLIVEDDGVGFDPAQLADGLGLRSIRSRAEFLGATLDIDSREHSGTTVTVILDLEKKV